MLSLGYTMQVNRSIYVYLRMVHMNWSITENLSTLCISISWRKRKISRHITSILYKSTNVRTYFFFSLDFLELIRSNSYACVIDQVSFGYSAIPFWPKFSTHHDVMSFFFGFIVMLHSLRAYWPSACGFSLCVRNVYYIA